MTYTMDPERALLGALLSGFDDLDALAIQPRDFYQPLHTDIFTAIVRVVEAGHRAEPMAVHVAMTAEQRQVLHRNGGPVYLVELMEGCIPVQAPFYATAVLDLSQKRRLSDMAQKLLQLAESDRPAADLVNDAKQWLDHFTATTATDTASIREAMVEVIEIAEKGRQRGLPTPWPDLDGLIRGFYPGRFYVIAARPGVGKSIAASNIAVHLAKRSHGVFVASMEMDRVEWTQRCAAAEAKVDIGRLEDGKLNEDDWTRLAAATPVIEGLPILINDAESQSLAHIRAAARRASRQHPLAAIIVDYLQLVIPYDPRIPRHEQVAYDSRGLKRMGREFGVPVIALAQLNRGSENRRDKRPVLSDLRESGSIEADADSVILLHVDEEEPQTVEAEVAKGRSTGRGRVKLQMQGNYSRLVSSAWTPSGMIA